MDNQTLFYICGIGLAASALVFSFIGLKSERFPGRAFPVVILWFAILVGGATTFSVLHAQDEEEHKAAEFEHAGEQIEAEQGSEPFEEAEEKGSEVEDERSEAESAGQATTLKLSADSTALAYDTTELSATAGEVTIDFDNPAPIEHDVAIFKDGEEVAGSDLVTEGDTSVTAELEPGTYTFLCTVPGHAAAGMEGTLTVE